MYLYFFLFLLIVTLVIFFLSTRLNFAQDNDFRKPQAIHSARTARTLGIPLIFLTIFLIYNKHLLDETLLNILIVSFMLSIVGLLEDLNFKINPYIRFFYQVFFVTFSYSFFDLGQPLQTFDFLPSLLKNNTFMFIFTVISILTIANSINFIDGCNGLVILYFIKIFIFLLLISLDNNLINFFKYILIYLFIVIFFNFPKAKLFLGDFGAYYLGFLTSYLFIFISNSSIEFKIQINEWFLAIMFLYPSFEIFSTVLRRVLNKKSPFFPDNYHLHSLIYRVLILAKFTDLFANYSTSLIISLLNLIIILSLFYIPLELYVYFYFIFFASMYLVRFILVKLLNKLTLLA